MPSLQHIRRTRAAMAALFAVAVAVAGVDRAEAVVPNTIVIQDTLTNPGSQHATAVEPDTYAYGNTMVAVAQIGRNIDGGAAGIGFATSTDGGATWTSGVLPGITQHQNPPGSYARVTDPVVAYDPLHGVWLAQSIVLQEVLGNVFAVAVLVNRSTDGGLTWSDPIVSADAAAAGADKNWIVCDTHAISPFYGRCYQTWDDNFGTFLQNYSTDGGLTWSPPVPTANNGTGLGGQPVVQPDGDVIVPASDFDIASLVAFRSTDGGVTWSAVTTVTPTPYRIIDGLRADALPTAEIDATGKVYVVWMDCRFRLNCEVNDLVMTTTTDGLTWSPVVRVPIDPVNGTIHHVVPGLGVDRSTSGANARLGLTYYSMSSSCSTSCQLDVAYVQSDDGGTTWTSPTAVAGPFPTTWLANTGIGRMVGDYISTSWMNGRAWPAFALASAPTGEVFHESIAVPAGGLLAGSVSPIDVCVKVGEDWRAPYANGTCPSTFGRVPLATTTGDGQQACVKVGTDVRAPYNTGSCPAGFQRVTYVLAEPAQPGQKGCFKPSTDVRAALCERQLSGRLCGCNRCEDSERVSCYPQPR